jgi:hypothetical protein
MIRQRRSVSSRMPVSGVRLLLFALITLLVAACGKAAQPRAAQPTPLPVAARSASTTERRILPTQASPVAPVPTDAARRPSSARALGDPSAPITVIEYGDYQ